MSELSRDNMESESCAGDVQRRLSQELALYRPRFLYLALFFAAYVLAAGFAQLLAIMPETGISLWPPGGLFMATLILTARWSWPWWVLAGLAAELAGNLLWFHNPLPVAVLIYAGNALEAMAGAWLVNRFCKRPARLETLQEVLALVVLGAGVAPVVSATVGSSTLALFGMQPFTRAWPLWWIGDATGVLIFAPLALVVLQGWQDVARFSTARVLEACILALIFLGISTLSLSGFLPFAYIIMPALLWAALRFELKGAVITLVLLALMTAVFTVTGLGQFAGDPESQKQKHVMLQLFLAISALSALIVAALSRQHQQALLTLQTANDDLERRVVERTETLRESEARMRLVQESTGVGTWDWNIATGEVRWSEQNYRLHGLDPAAGPPSYDDWRQAIHPDDRDRTDAAVLDAVSRRAGFDTEYRISVKGSVRWLVGRGHVLSDAAGRPERMMGVNVDITTRKGAEEQQSLLAREVDHRAKNALAVVQSLIRLTRAEDPAAFARALEGRIAALARAHTLLARERWAGGNLALLLAEELAAYRSTGQVVLTGPTVALKADAVQPLSMSLHELATNAAKYGALSIPDGRVEIDWRVERGALILTWREVGGPRVAAPPQRTGFGAKLLDAAVRGQLGGEVNSTWRPSGLCCELRIAADRLQETPLPAKPAPPPATARMTSTSACRRGLRVLLGEDETLLALDLANELRDLGCEVVGVAESVEDLQPYTDAAAARIDLAVLDVNLGGQASFPIADALLAQEIPVIFATGYGDLPRGHWAGNPQVVLLRKPVASADLAHAIASLFPPPREGEREDVELARDQGQAP
jgi:PAS domain S-box-containing protein